MKKKVLGIGGVVVALAIAVPALALSSGEGSGSTHHRGATGPSGGGPGKRAAVSVTPATGGPSTTFTVSFTSREPTGTVAGTDRSYAIGAQRAGKRTGCVSAASSAAPPAGMGDRVRVRLVPWTLGGRWCSGTFRGQVTELARAACTPGMMCPQFVRLVARLGGFTFAVKPSG